MVVRRLCCLLGSNAVVDTNYAGGNSHVQRAGYAGRGYAQGGGRRNAAPLPHQQEGPRGAWVQRRVRAVLAYT